MPGTVNKASGSFLKKRTKKLLLTGGVAMPVPQPKVNRSFFASFFCKKKEALT
jgi:hypothetical protein